MTNNIDMMKHITAPMRLAHHLTVQGRVGAFLSLLFTLLILVSVPTAGRAAEKLVFAHYMICMPPTGGSATVNDFKNDIVLAQSYGIDGFALNCGGWTVKYPYYKARTLMMYQAAQELGTGFKLFISEDHVTAGEITDMVQTFYHHPNQFRCGGLPVMSSYSDQLSGQFLDGLRSQGCAIFWMPNYHVTDMQPVYSPDNIAQIISDTTNTSGYFDFSPAGTGASLSKNILTLAPACQHVGKVFMPSVTPYYRGLTTGNYRVFETRGCESLEAEWQAAISADVPWVELATWNDFSEQTYFMPFSTAQESSIYHASWGSLLSHAGYMAACSYYINWYKFGQAPPITNDVICYTYRLFPHTLKGRINPGIPTDHNEASPKGASALLDNIFVTLFLKAPADLVITSGTSTATFHVGAGVSNVDMPFMKGGQHFVLKRGSAAIISKTGEHDITAEDASSNFGSFSGYATGS